MITAATFDAPNWVDLSTPDIEAALDFYGGLFGWEIEKSITPMGDYFIGKTAGRQVCGLMKAGPEMAALPAIWTTFFNVADVDAKVRKAGDIGGRILEPPFDIPDARIAVVADPTGAMFGLISGPEPQAVWMDRVPGRVSWIEVLTRNPGTAEAFYTELFDWKAETATEPAGVEYTTFKLDEDPVAGMMLMPETVPPEAPSHWAVYFTVGDAEEAINRTAELGGRILMPATPIELGRFAVLEDPQGGVFQIMEYAR